MKRINKIAGLLIVGVVFVCAQAFSIQQTAQVAQRVLTVQQEVEVMSILMQNVSAQSAQAQVVSKLATYGKSAQAAQAIWSSNVLVVGGLSLLHRNIHATDIKSRVDVSQLLALSNKYQQTSLCLAASTLLASGKPINEANLAAQMRTQELAAASQVPGARTLDPETLRAKFGSYRFLDPKPVVDAGVETGAAWKSRIKAGLENFDERAIAEATAWGKVVAAIEGRGCPINRTSGISPECGVLRRGAEQWRLAKQNLVADQADPDVVGFQVDVIATGLNHPNREAVEKGNERITADAIQPGYWDQHVTLQECYLGKQPAIAN